MKPEPRDLHGELHVRVNASGDVTVPRAFLEAIGVAAGAHVQVRITASRRAGTLKKRGITEEEIDGIAALQLEAREQVVRVLSVEGTLASHGRFRQRLARMRT